MKWIRLIVPVLAALLAINLGFGAACIETTDPNEPGECWDHGDCSEMEACKDGWCENIQCLTSSNCLVNEYCDTSSYLCVSGCLENADCAAGYACDADSTTCLNSTLTRRYCNKTTRSTVATTNSDAHSTAFTTCGGSGTDRDRP